jgi:anaerobic dimethyl sulfoxide reductase subunit C (anchor subunit)
LFTAFLAAFVFLRWKKMGSDAQQSVCAVLAGVFGVLLVCSMSMIYTSIRTQPSWSTSFTPFSFFNTVLLLGALGAGAIVTGNHFSSKVVEADEKEPQRTLARRALRGLSLGAIVLVGIELVALPIYLLHLAGDPAGAMTAQAIASEMRGVMVLRLILVVAGAGVLASLAYGFLAESRRTILAGRLVHVALALVLVAELLGRFIFYVSKVRIGV